jgi:hypothetical protein
MWVAWTGLKALAQEIDKTISLIDPTALMILNRATAIIEARAKRNFSGSHKAGAPHVGGDKPNIVTGYLRRSIMSTPPVHLGIASYAATIGPTAVYGRAVELGLPRWKHGGYPYFEPAVRDSETEIAAMALQKWAAIL